jgi:hypothetical protein
MEVGFECVRICTKVEKSDNLGNCTKERARILDQFPN